jgi:hypothetical protein
MQWRYALAAGVVNQTTQTVARSRSRIRPERFNLSDSGNEKGGPKDALCNGG